MFETEIIYERKYPHKTAEEEMEETEKWAEEHPREVAKIRVPPFSEFLEDIKSKRTIVPLPDRETQTKEFIKCAIEAGETYEMDTKIVKMDSHISVTYRFDCGGGMDYLMPVLRQGDSISFFTGNNGFDITLIIDHYTHAEYLGERLIHPLAE